MSLVPGLVPHARQNIEIALVGYPHIHGIACVLRIGLPAVKVGPPARL
jgi:hypothetical protein